MPNKGSDFPCQLIISNANMWPEVLVQKTRKLVREERKRREISAKKKNNEIMSS